LKINKFLFLILFVSGLAASAVAQIHLTGVVIDSDNKFVLPFVNIGIKHKNIGTTSLHDGTFSITIPPEYENDSLLFSMVGYSDLTISIEEIKAASIITFPLNVKITELNTITVSTEKLVEKKFGIKNKSTLLTFIDGSTNQNDIFEIAQLIKLDTTLSKITSVNLYLNESRNDSGTFRINFYDFDGRIPVNKIIEKNIVQVHSIKEGWLQFDLENENIYLKGNFVVSIEFIPTEKKTDPIYYEVKLGGSARSFVRTSSQGEWNVPPHHYRLYVTALVPDTRKTYNQDADEKESIPLAHLYSQSVKDSFYIFVRTPEGYSKNKNQLFPVIYLLDANYYFDNIATLMNEKSSQAILVGIGYKDFLQMDSLRERDYTFPIALSTDSFPVSGGADKFLTFIEKELISFIDTLYKTDKINRTIMGHSLGGYFTLFALQTELKERTTYFKHYIAASPSLHYHNQYLFKQFQNIAEADTHQRTLFLTLGAREDKEDGGTGTENSDNFNSFVKQLGENKFHNIKTHNVIYSEYGHMQTAIPTFTESLQEIK